MEPTPSSLPTVEDRQSQALQLFAFPMELDGQKPFAILCFCRWVSSLVSVLVLFLFLCFCMREKKKKNKKKKKKRNKVFPIENGGLRFVQGLKELRHPTARVLCWHFCLALGRPTPSVCCHLIHYV